MKLNFAQRTYCISFFAAKWVFNISYVSPVYPNIMWSVSCNNVTSFYLDFFSDCVWWLGGWGDEASAYSIKPLWNNPRGFLSQQVGGVSICIQCNNRSLSFLNVFLSVFSSELLWRWRTWIMFLTICSLTQRTLKGWDISYTSCGIMDRNMCCDYIFELDLCVCRSPRRVIGMVSCCILATCAQDREDSQSMCCGGGTGMRKVLGWRSKEPTISNWKISILLPASSLRPTMVWVSTI